MMDNIPPDQAAIFLAVAIYVTKELLKLFKHTVLKTKSITEKNTEAVKELILEMKFLEQRLSSVEIAIDKFTEFKSVVWKLEKDVSFAHEKIRDLTKRAQ